MKKFKIITLGCKVNQAESEAMGATLTTPDWHPVETSEAADLCIINTCAVTQKAAMQSRQAVRQAIHANPQAWVVVTGCYAQTEPQALVKIDGIDYILDQAGKQRLAEMVRGGELTKCARAVMFQPAPGAASVFAAAKPVPSAHRTRPFLKIQDGCDAFCTYCIVPYARGRSRSMAFSAVLESIAELVAQGVHEAVLTGIHLGHYGRDLKPPCGLLQLLQAIAALESPIRVRLSSIEPLEMTDELLSLVARSDRICRHFHIPLQSGDHAILKRMGRPYSPEFFADRVKKIRCHDAGCRHRCGCSRRLSRRNGSGLREHLLPDRKPSGILPARLPVLGAAGDRRRPISRPGSAAGDQGALPTGAAARAAAAHRVLPQLHRPPCGGSGGRQTRPRNRAVERRIRQLSARAVRRGRSFEELHRSRLNRPGIRRQPVRQGRRES